MGHGVRWGRDHQIKHRTSTIYRTLSARMVRPPPRWRIHPRPHAHALRPQTPTYPAAKSLPATIESKSTVSARQIAPFSNETRLWRAQEGALSAAFRRGSGEAMWAGKEGLARWFMVPGASRQLARAKAGRSPGFDGSKSRPIPPPRDLDAFGRAPVAVR